MKKLLGIRKWKIKYKLTAAMYMVLIPVLFGITFYVYLQGVKTVREELTTAYESLTRTVNDNVSYVESDIEDVITYIVINDDFRFVLNTAPNSKVAKNPLVWQQETPSEFVTEMLCVKNNISGFGLFPENGIKPYIVTRNNIVMNQNIAQIREIECLKTSEKSLGDMKMMKMDKNDTSLILNNMEDRIVFGKAVMSYDKEETLGYLCAFISAEDMIATFTRDRLEENESIYLFDQAGNEIVHSGEAAEGDIKKITHDVKNWNSIQKYQETTESYIFSSQNQDYGYSVFYVVPKENWNKQLKSVARVPIIIALVLFFAAFPIFNFVTRFITIPLSSLHESMLKLQEGDFKEQIPVYMNDEIGDVTTGYNEMVRHIDALINKNYVMVLRERESELNILQAQINPHFLYNTLDSLYWDAFDAGNAELAENIMALSELFRLALSRGEGIVSVETEFMLIDSYLHIQKMRFEKRLEYKINLLSEMKEYEIPKFILQPFVENAIVHGLENTNRSGFINVHGYVDERDMIFKITDNGIGMNEEQLQEVFAEDTRQYSNQRISKYAIKNVRERLKLRYKEDFSLEISSTLGVGTTVTLKIRKQL